MGMKFVRKVSLFFFFAFSIQLFAQAPAAQAPAEQPPVANDRPAGSLAIFEASGGYVFMSMTSPSTSRVNFNGVDGNALLHFTPRWGATLDLTFARSGILPGTNHSDNVFSALIGPVYYIKDSGKTGVFVHALIGTAWVDSAVPLSPTSEFKGYETRFSYAFGGGVERTLSGPFSFRVTGDYQRTSFVNPLLALEGQNNLRVTTSLVYRFGNRWSR